MNHFTRKFIDAHSHICDPRLTAEKGLVQKWIAEAEQRGVCFFMQGGVSPEDWQKQIELSKRYPKKIGLCFGLHPYFVAANDDETCEAALDKLAQALPDSLGIGEMGLDFRPHVMKDSQDRQIDVFREQIELAEISQKPMVLHLVQAFEESIRILDIMQIPASKGMVHSFNGSLHQAMAYIERGLYLSIGGPIARKNNERLRQAVAKIPLEQLLLETDAPDQSPDQFKDQLNPLVSLFTVAEAVASVRRMETLEILEISSHNFRRLFNLPE